MGICCFWPLPATESARVLLSEYLDFNVTAHSLIANTNPITPQKVYLRLAKQGIGNGYCVDYVKYVTGTILSGNANQWVKYINSTEPKVGSIVVLNEGPVGHVAVVLKVNSISIIITEQNFISRYVISQREVQINDPDIKGYIIP